LGNTDIEVKDIFLLQKSSYHVLNGENNDVGLSASLFFGTKYWCCISI